MARIPFLLASSTAFVPRFCPSRSALGCSGSVSTGRRLLAHARGGPSAARPNSSKRGYALGYGQSSSQPRH